MKEAIALLCLEATTCRNAARACVQSTTLRDRNIKLAEAYEHAAGLLGVFENMPVLEALVAEIANLSRVST